MASIQEQPETELQPRDSSGDPGPVDRADVGAREEAHDAEIQVEVAEFDTELPIGPVRPPLERGERDRLVEAHLGLANHLARRFAHRGEALDDLEQVAALALVKAVDRFDPGRGLEFSTFAVPTIVGELKRHFRDRAWAVRVPRRLQELHLQVAAGAAELAHELKRSPTVPELAEHLGVSPEDVLEAMEAGQAYRSDSLDASVPSESADQDPTLASRLGSEDPEYGKLADQHEVAELLKGLPERERTIVMLRFFQNLSQSQIAERVGISQMHVSRLLSRSLVQLRSLALAAAEAERDEGRPDGPSRRTEG